MTMGFKLESKTVVSIARIVLFGIALIAIALMVDVPDSTNTYDTYAEQVDDLRKRARAEKLRADSLNRVILERDIKIEQSDRRVRTLNTQLATLRGSTSVLEGQVDSLTETLTDSVTMAREIIPRQATIIVQKDEEIKTQGLIITEHVYTIHLRDQTISGLRISNDSLTALVLDIPEAPPNPNKLFGLIPMPSRTTTFVLGAVVGGVAVVSLVK